MSTLAQHSPTVSPGLLRDYTTTITILEHLSDAVFILSADGSIQYANHNATDMLRLPIEMLLGKNIMDYLAGDNEAFFDQVLHGVYNEVETMMINDGYKTPVVISFGIVYGQEGDVSYIIASAKDLTIKTEFEREWQQHQLINTLREKYRELGDLAVNVVHEISQPLTTVRLMAELTKKNLSKQEPDIAAVQKNLQTILDMTDSMGQAITRVRSFAMQTEDDTLQPVDMLNLLDDAVQQIAYELKERDIEVVTDALHQIPSVMANPIGLQQVFVILLKNEWEWFALSSETKQDHKKIYISLRNNEQKWLDVRISHLPAGKSKSAFNGRPVTSNRSLDISMAQIIVSMFGGELLQHQKNKQNTGYIVRLPVSHNNEREQLLNLIDLMQSSV